MIKSNISHKYKFIYIGPMRTASRFIGRIFTKYYNMEGGHQHWLDLTQELINNYALIISVRNPYSRVVSLYWWRQDTNNDSNTIIKFPDFPLTRKTDTQVSYLKNFKPNYILHTEELTQDFNHLPFIKNFHNMDFMVNYGSRPQLKWQDLYKQYPKAQELIYKAFKEDFDYFEYPYEL